MRIVAMLVCIMTPALLWAAPAGPAVPDNAGSPVEKIRKDLDRPITLKIDKQPLSAAMEMLRTTSKINIVLDSLTIQQQLGFAPDQTPVPVSVDLKDVKTRTALRAILAPYGLGYAVIGDSVIVTTDDMAMLRQMRQRVSVDVSKMELGAALKQLSRETAANLILDSRVEKEAQVAVSLQIEDVPLETAVRLLSEMAGLKPVRVGNTLFVTKKEIANEMRNDPEFAQPNQGTATTYINGLGGPQAAQFIIGNAVVTQPVPLPAPNGPPAFGPATIQPVVPLAPAPPATGTAPPPASDTAPTPKDGPK